jgi:hypothetical protein
LGCQVWDNAFKPQIIDFGSDHVQTDEDHGDVFDGAYASRRDSLAQACLTEEQAEEWRRQEKYPSWTWKGRRPGYSLARVFEQGETHCRCSEQGIRGAG